MTSMNSNKGDIGDMDFELVFDKPTLTPDRIKKNTDKNPKRRPRAAPIHLASHAAFLGMLGHKDIPTDSSLPYIPPSSRKRGGRRTRRRTTRKHKGATKRRKGKSSTKRRKKTRRHKK